MKKLFTFILTITLAFSVTSTCLANSAKAKAGAESESESTSTAYVDGVQATSDLDLGITITGDTIGDIVDGAVTVGATTQTANPVFTDGNQTANPVFNDGNQTANPVFNDGDVIDNSVSINWTQPNNVTSPITDASFDDLDKDNVHGNTRPKMLDLVWLNHGFSAHNWDTAVRVIYESAYLRYNNNHKKALEVVDNFHSLSFMNFQPALFNVFDEPAQEIHVISLAQIEKLVQMGLGNLQVEAMGTVHLQPKVKTDFLFWSKEVGEGSRFIQDQMRIWAAEYGRERGATMMLQIDRSLTTEFEVNSSTFSLAGLLGTIKTTQDPTTGMGNTTGGATAQGQRAINRIGSGYAFFNVDWNLIWTLLYPEEKKIEMTIKMKKTLKTYIDSNLLDAFILVANCPSVDAGKPDSELWNAEKRAQGLEKLYMSYIELEDHEIDIKYVYIVLMRDWAKQMRQDLRGTKGCKALNLKALANQYSYYAWKLNAKLLGDTPQGAACKAYSMKYFDIWQTLTKKWHETCR